MIRLVLLTLLILALLEGCAPPPTSPVPADLQVCPDAATPPAVPPRVRTTEAVGVFAVRSDAARERDAMALKECAARLNRLNDWISKRGGKL